MADSKPVYCLSQCEIVKLEVIQKCLYPCNPIMSTHILKSYGGDGAKIFVASVLYSHDVPRERYVGFNDPTPHITGYFGDNFTG